MLRCRYMRGGSVSPTKSTGEVEIGFRYERHLGPRFIHGGVTLQFGGAGAYAFTSTANWPGSENYDEAIRLVVEATLREVQGHLRSPHVCLKEIEWDAVSSCQRGFENAARAATLAAFEV